MNLLIAALVTFLARFIALPSVLALARAFGLYATVNEGECRVYVLTSAAERRPGDAAPTKERRAPSPKIR